MDNTVWCSGSTQSQCATDSITGVLSTLFLLLFVFRLWKVYPMTPAEHTEIKWLFAFLFSISIELSLTMLEGVYHNMLSVSFIFKLTLELLFWLVLYILVVIEAYRLLNWPWNWVAASVFLVNFPDLSYAFFTIQSSERSSIALYAIWSVKIVISLVVVLMYSVKSFYDANQDAYDIHLRDRSEDFYSSSPIKTIVASKNGLSSHREKSESASITSKIFGLKSSKASSASSRDNIESAISRNINDDHNRSQRNNQNSNSFLGMFSWFSSTTNTSASANDQEASQKLIEDEELQKMQPYEEHRYSSMSSASFSSNGSMGSSRALMQVMEQHRAKVTALNPILEPKGVDYYDDSSSSRKKASDLQSDTEESVFEKLRFQVLVQKWGLRNKKLSSAVAGGSEKEKRSDESDGPMENSEAKTEIEFEIVVASRSGGTDRQQVDWNKAYAQKTSAVTRWTVWRSLEEITKLHSQMVNLMGDLIPRRPRLNSSSGNANSLSYTELVSDMRAIAIYLNALLRSKQFIRKPLEEFLELERAKFGGCDVKDGISEKQITTGIKENISLAEEPPKDSAIEEWEKSVLGKVGSEPNAASNSLIPANSIATTGSQKAASGVITKQQTFAAASTSLMDAAEKNAAGDQTVARQEKWRKLFTRMKIKLKPSEVGIRCRLFEGVLSGGDITAWLMRSATADTAGEVDRHSVIDRTEACSIGQELLDCGLLELVCSGFKDEESELYDDHDGLIDSADQPDHFQSAFGDRLFSDMPGFVYRFPGKSGTAGCWTLFGAPIYVKIPTMTIVEDSDIRSTRDTTTITLYEPSAGDIEGGDAPGPSGGNTHVKYVIDITHGGDIWQITRRYREFENLHKTLAKEGIRAEVALPPKSFMMSAMSRNKKQMHESRRIGLEQYLSSLLQAVIDNGSDKDKLILAKFLDDEYYNLRVLGDSKSDTSIICEPIGLFKTVSSHHAIWYGRTPS